MAVCRPRAEGRPLAGKGPAPGNGAVSRHNGRPEKSAAPGMDTAPSGITPTGEVIRDISVQIPPRDVEIEVFADNRNAASTHVIVRVVWAGEPVSEPAIRGQNLYLLAVGVSRYNNPDYRLEFAAQDATEFAQTMQAQKGAVYQDVRVTLLTDDNATHDRVRGRRLSDRVNQLTQGQQTPVIIAPFGVADFQIASAK
jgi:hypothetical protein